MGVYICHLHNFLSRLGALDLEPLKKRKRNYTPRSKSKQAKATKPKEIVNLEDEEESTTKDVARVLEALKKECERRGRVHYFKFLVDPNSFAHTVENMFHFAFLVKDGRAGVTLGRDGQPYVFIRKSIQLCSCPFESQLCHNNTLLCLFTASDLNEYGQSTKTVKQQVITSFTMSDWQV